MPRFAVGYQPAEPGEESFVETVRAHREAVAEVYFAWLGHPSGRSPIGLGDATAWPRFADDLCALRALGVRLDVLFNSNCYGAEAMSRALDQEVGRVLAVLADLVGGVDVVTTTSPAVAHIVRRRAPGIELRASVNLRIGTVEGMAYLAHLFDSYHVQRDHNRDLTHLRELAQWAAEHDKKLVLLANSGCLRYCSGQTFHDNLVAHEREVAANDNLPDLLPYACWHYLSDRDHWPALLQSTWVRPEDLHHYSGLFPLIKLATRLHERPHQVIAAYVRGRWEGNLLDLCEPGFSPALAPWVIDNARFPAEWFAVTSTCDRRCHRCDYCAAVLERVLRRID